MNEEKIREVILLFWIMIIWEIVSSLLTFIPMADLIDIPIDIVIIALCYSLYGPIALVLTIELIPFIDLLPIYLLFAVFVIFKDDRTEKDKEVVGEKPIKKKREIKKSKFPICIICLNEIKTETFTCICGAIYHKQCFSDFSAKQGCPNCGRPLDTILKKKGISNLS